MANYFGSPRPQSSLADILRAAADAAPRGSNLQTPSGHWQTMRRHGNVDELAVKARSYIQNMLIQEQRQNGR